MRSNQIQTERRLKRLQEHITDQSVALSTKTAKLTGRVLASLMRETLRQMRRSRDKPREGRQTVRQLAKGGSLESVEITDDNIKAFEPFARKFGVSYALQRDVSEEPPRWLVFFRAKDAAALEGAFKAFTASMVKRDKERPSTRDAMHKFRDRIRNAVRDKTKHKHREGPEL
jgi:hypothetical protein